MEILLMLPLYGVLALPALLFLWLIYWLLKKSPWGQKARAAFFSILTVIMLTPFIMQADVAVVIGPAYLAALPTILAGNVREFVRVLMSALPLHLVGLVVIGLISVFVTRRFLFPSR